MFSAYLFLVSAVLLGICMYVWDVELRKGVRFFATTREWTDRELEQLQRWFERNLTPENLIRHGQDFATYLTHHGARFTARFGHILEYRARTVVHRTARRVRKQAHYLEEVTSDEALDRNAKKGNNTASEQ